MWNRTLKALPVIMLTVLCAVSIAGTAHASPPSASDAPCTPTSVDMAVTRFVGFWNSDADVLEISTNGEYTIWMRDLDGLGTHYITVSFDGTYTEQTTAKPQRGTGFTPPAAPLKHGTWMSNGTDITFSGLGTASRFSRQMYLMRQGLYKTY